MKQLLISMLFTVILLAINIQAADIIVDNDAGAPGYTETGSWTTSSMSGYNGGNYRYTQFTSPASTATWRPVIDTTGYYSVYTIFRRGANRTSNAPYTINHADGANMVSVDQTASFSGDISEVLLGVFRFTTGSTGTIILQNNGGNGVYIADTIRLAPDTPPDIDLITYFPLYPQDSQAFTISARVTDNSGIGSVQINWSASPSGATGSATAYDDGAHGDGAAADSFYGVSLPGFPTGDTVSITFTATDTGGSFTISGVTDVVIGQTATWQLVINELMASNTGTISDPDFGESADWIELYNLGPDTADLAGLAMSDTDGTPDKWLFPTGTTLAAGSYMLVWCDDMNTSITALHTNFKLSASGENAILYDTNSATIVDQILFPSLASDESYARIPDQTGSFAKTVIPTPGSVNMAGTRGNPPVLSLPSGLYSGSISVTISAPGATEIRYTTDGSEPTPTSTLYIIPLDFSSTTGLRARAYYPVDLPSVAASASYFFDFIADRTIPIMNILIKPADLFDPTTGIYANYNERGDAWERPAYAVIMNPDGSQVYECGVGLRINGGTSRAAAKKSLRFYTRSSYGQNSWSLPWLTQTTAASFDNLVLRANNNDGILNPYLVQLNEVTFIRDQILRDWHGDSGATSVDGFYIALYLNGEYWGLYNAVERVTDNYMDKKAGNADWDVVKGTWDYTLKYNTEVLDGDITEWNAFLAWLDANDVSTPTGLNELKQKIDYEQFLEYFALNIATQNEDWPHNNWIATKRRDDPTAKWTFHQNDSEWALGLRPQGYQSDTLTWAQGSNYHISTSHNGTIAPLSKLFNGNELDPYRTTDINGILDNPQGRLDFFRALDDSLNFELVPANAIADVDAYEALIETEVPRESNRWEANMIMSDTAFNAAWPLAIDNMRTFLTNRPAYVRDLVITKFGLGGTRAINFMAGGTGTGKLNINGRVVSLPWSGTFFDTSSIDLAAVADTGSAFQSWSGDISDSSPSIAYSVSAGLALNVTLNFDPALPEAMPNDVIFNEYWVNDNGTSYTDIGAIEGDWIELLVVIPDTDLRGWRITNNQSITEQSTIDDGDGSLIFPDIPALASIPAGTIILVISSINDTNTATFPTDDLDHSDYRLIFYRGNDNLDDTTDVGFGVTNSNEALTLLAPGPTSSFADDIGVDFIAEGSTTTPDIFFGTPTPPVSFPNPFSGIGGDDGAVFTNSTGLGFNNDDGSDPNNSDSIPGEGGWIVDPPAAYSGDAAGTNILTPGYPNTGQDISSLLGSSVDNWDKFLY